VAQNIHFSVKRAHFWLVPILVLAGLFSWAPVQEGGQPQPVKTELVVSATKNKVAKRLWYKSGKQFTPALTTSTEAFAARTIQVRWLNQVKIFSRIKSTITFATRHYWKSRSITYILTA
jgi:hypothetical protein